MLQRHLAKRTFQHASPLAAAHFELHHPLQPWLLPAEGFRIWTLELHNVDLWAIWFIFGPILKNVWSGAKIKQIWSLKKSGILAYPPFTLFNVRSRQKTCVHAGFTLVSRCFTLWFFQNFQLPFLMLQCNFPAFTGFLLPTLMLHVHFKPAICWHGDANVPTHMQQHILYQHDILSRYKLINAYYMNYSSCITNNTFIREGHGIWHCLNIRYHAA